MSRKKSPVKYSIKNRIYSVMIIFILIYAFLIYRLIDIQVIKSEYYRQCALEQSSSTLNLSSGRGIIYDRNNKKLTDNKVKDIIVVQKDKININNEYMNLIEKATGLNSDFIYDKIQEDPVSPIVEFEITNINNDLKKELEDEDILIDKKTYRYSDDNMLTHTIGYIDGDGNGITGIEKSQEDILKDKNLDYIEVFKAGSSGNSGDSKKIGVLNGSIKTEKNSSKDNHLKLTVDYNIQKKLEALVDKEENPNSVIISDVKTGEIIAMTSRPNYNRNDIEEYMKLSNGSLENRAIRYMYAPASVFKIVVLYAALENNIIDENYTYTCTGSLNVNERVLHCNKLDGHGHMTLEEAFANSCNPAFLDIALKVGVENIKNAAKSLHLDAPVGIDVYGEKNGTIEEGIDIVNLAIGQGQMMFTPLQVNQMTQVIANNGLYKQLHIYDSVIDNDKNIVKDFKTTKEDEPLSPYVTFKIKEMMKAVSTYGTAKELNDLEEGCGVKTGTAQAKINVQNEDKSISKKTILHGWTTGFYPEENPKYAITVIIEGTEHSNKSAVPLFKDICSNILK